jgi:hypothetical protein
MMYLFDYELVSRGFPGGLTRSPGSPGPDKNPAATPGLAKTSIMIIIYYKGA